MPPFDTGTSSGGGRRRADASRQARDGRRRRRHGRSLNTAGCADRFTYISTAGGAFLEWLEGKALPGVEVLKRK